MSFIEFKENGTSPSGKTKRWNVTAKAASTVSLGSVRWYEPWRRYTFEATNAVFDQDCLQEITTFLGEATEKHYQELEKQKA
jgi:hypothetical protein